MSRAACKLRLFVQIMACLWAVCFWAGCADDELDDTNDIYRGSSDSGASDAGVDVFEDARPWGDAYDERCDGKQAGARCELAHGSGVCVQGRCQFLSCESGFRDCDQDMQNGCETDITTEAQCGGCGVTCSAAESCQLSSAGFVCSVSPVCTDGTYDMDGEGENGCEWADRWGEEGLFDPSSFEPHVAGLLSSGGFAVAGKSGQERLVTATNATETAEPLPIDGSENAAAQAVAEVSAGDSTSLVAVAWSDGVSVSSPSGSTSDDGTFSYSCDDASGQRTPAFTGVASLVGGRLFASTTHEVLQLHHGPDCAASPQSPAASLQICADPVEVIDTRDYVDAYFPQIDPSACDVCVPDAASCPTFRPIGLAHAGVSDTLIVFTARGFFLLEVSDDGFVPGARLEYAQAEQGASYVAGTTLADGDDLRIFSLTSNATLRQFRVDLSLPEPTIEPAGPDIGLLLESPSDAALHAASDGTLLVTDARQAWLVRPTERSARIEQLPEPDVFLGDERIIYGAGVEPEAGLFSLLYFGLGRYYLRDVSLGNVSR